MAYKYDIFISYRRDALTRQWIEEHFVPLIELHVRMELGRVPIIYIDSQLENGTTWPISLGKALGSSRTIIPLWTKTFLHSVWCTHEIGHMLERETKTGFRTYEKPSGLIFPTIIHDGETLPVNLLTIQKIEIQDCFNVRMSKNSPKAEILDDKLKPLGKDIADAILLAPDWIEDWEKTAVNNFVTQYHISIESQQNSTPKFTN
jgi:hypothetical protein